MASPPAWQEKQCQRPDILPERWAAKLGLCLPSSAGRGCEGRGQWQRHSSRTPLPGSGTATPARRSTAGSGLRARTAVDVDGGHHATLTQWRSRERRQGLRLPGMPCLALSPAA